MGGIALLLQNQGKKALGLDRALWAPSRPSLTGWVWGWVWGWARVSTGVHPGGLGKEKRGCSFGWVKGRIQLPLVPHDKPVCLPLPWL